MKKTYDRELHDKIRDMVYGVECPNGRSEPFSPYIFAFKPSEIRDEWSFDGLCREDFALAARYEIEARISCIDGWPFDDAEKLEAWRAGLHWHVGTTCGLAGTECMEKFGNSGYVSNFGYARDMIARNLYGLATGEFDVPQLRAFTRERGAGTIYVKGNQM